MPSQWRPSLVASLHLEALTRLWEGNQVLEQMVGLSVHESGGGGYLVLSRRVARATTIWAHASARRWGETWVQSIKIPRFLAVFGGRAYSPQGSWHVPALLEGGGVSELFSSIFFSTSFEQKKGAANGRNLAGLCGLLYKHEISAEM